MELEFQKYSPNFP